MTQHLHTCALCDKPINPVSIGGRTLVKDYCYSCDLLYTKEIGEGWQHQEWAQDLFRTHRKWLRSEAVEAEHCDLEEADEKGATPIESVSEDIITVAVDLAWRISGQRYGAPMLKHIINEMGLEVSERTISRRLAEIKRNEAA